jgi:hypothetical protein
MGTPLAFLEDDLAGQGLAQDEVRHDGTCNGPTPGSCNRSCIWNETQDCSPHAERVSQHATIESQIDELLEHRIGIHNGHTPSILLEQKSVELLSIA